MVDGAGAEPPRDDASGADDYGGLLGDVRDGLAKGDVDAEVAEAVTSALGDLGDYASERRDVELPVAAADVLEDYRAQGVELVYADYLGVLEDTWACLVKGDRWVEICIVREDEADGTSKVETVHFDADRFAEALPPELLQGEIPESLSTDLQALEELGGALDAGSTGEGAGE